MKHPTAALKGPHTEALACVNLLAKEQDAGWSPAAASILARLKPLMKMLADERTLLMSQQPVGETENGKPLFAGPVIPPAPSVADAEHIGAKGAPNTPEERALFEAYMKGHCWGFEPYNEDLGLYPEMHVRMIYGAFRDRGALERQALGAPGQDGNAQRLLSLVAMAHSLSAYAAAPFFSSKIKVGAGEDAQVVQSTTTEWWTGLREQIETLQPLLETALQVGKSFPGGPDDSNPTEGQKQ